MPMKRLLACYKNWRIDVLIAFAVIAFFLIASDIENFRVWAIVKTSGIALLILDTWLYLVWKSNGKLTELDSIEE
jgi:hypothetical protein